MKSKSAVASSSQHITWCHYPEVITMNLADLPGFLVYSCGPKSLQKRRKMSILWDLYIKRWPGAPDWHVLCLMVGMEMKPTVDVSLLHHSPIKVLQSVQMINELSPNRLIPPVHRALCGWYFMNADCSIWSTNRWRVGGGTDPETGSWI